MQQTMDLKASMLLQMEDTEDLMSETLDLIEQADKIYQEFKKVRKNIKYLYDELDEAQAREPGSVSHLFY